MTDIRLEELPFEFEGRTYLLRCNMNVLADVQESYGGTISDALSGADPSRSVLEFLAAMLNDYADEQGWPERHSVRSLGRRFAMNMLPTAEVMSLVVRSMRPPDSAPQPETAVSDPDTEAPDPSGN